MQSGEKAYRTFTNDEIQVGIAYALEKCDEQLAPVTLNIIASTAGAIFVKEGCLPRTAAYLAISAWRRNNRGIYLSPERVEAYIRATAKMMSERNPKTIAKRKRDKVNAPFPIVLEGDQFAWKFQRAA